MIRLCLFVLFFTGFIYQGCTGQVLPPDCLATGCGDHGMCVDYGDTHRCSCDPGFEGSTTKCVRREDLVNCPTRPCTGGKCVMDDTWTRVCQCDSGYNPSLADPTVCVAATSSTVLVGEDCTIGGCTNGVCVNILDVNKCVCMMNYTISDVDKYVCEPIAEARIVTPPRGCQATGCIKGVCVSGQNGVPGCVCNRGYQLSVRKDNVCLRKKNPPPSQMSCDVYGCTNGYCTRQYSATPYCQCRHGYKRHPFNRFQCIRKSMKRRDPWS